jgi:regulator of sigma E protease
MQLLTWLWVLLEVVLLFGAAIFVHELGHFLVARWRGLKVEGFSIGFGPKIFGWTRDGIDYALRWIPAGGFVRLPQMITSDALEGKNAPAAPLPPISPLSKTLVALAGPIMNAVFAFVLATLLFFIGLPVLVNPAIVGAVEPGSPEAQLGIRPGDRVVSVDGHAVKSWQEAQQITMLAPTNVLRVVIERAGVQTTYYLTARMENQLGVKLLNLDPTSHPVIRDVFRGSPAEQAGLRRGDEVLALAGARVIGTEQLTELIKKRPNQPSSIEVLRGETHVALTVTPKLEPAAGIGVIGVEIGASTRSVYQVQWPGPLPWTLVGQICQETFDTITALFHSKQTGVGVGNLSGPPGILAALAAEVKADFRLGLRFMILLNISLAVLNLLPLPVLDGGHIAMAFLEQLRGRPLSPRVQEYATTAFAVLLISFMLYVSYNDVRRFPLFRSLFNQQVQIETGSASSNSASPTPNPSR